MRFYWSNHSIPELRDLPRSEQVRLQAEARERLAGRHGWKIGIAITLCVVGPFALAIVIASLLPERFDTWGDFAMYSLALAFGVVLVQVHTHACRPIYREIRERDYGEPWDEAEIRPGEQRVN